MSSKWAWAQKKMFALSADALNVTDIGWASSGELEARKNNYFLLPWDTTKVSTPLGVFPQRLFASQVC